MLGLAASLQKGGASLLTFVKDNLKLYLDFKSNKSDTLKFPSEGSTSFNGTSDYIDLPMTFSYTNHSVIFWAYIDNTSITKTAFDARDSGLDGIEIRILPDESIQTRINDNASSYSTTIYREQWVHLAHTYDGSHRRLYINGERVINEATTQTIDTTTNPKIGSRSFSDPVNFFAGKMANMGLWSRALTPEEIQSIMNKSYSQLKGVEKTSLVAWWALDSQSDGLVQPATGEVLGDELITDGEFTDENNWNVGAGVSFVDGQAVWSTSGTIELKQNITINSGKLYKVVLDANVNNPVWSDSAVLT